MLALKKGQSAVFAFLLDRGASVQAANKNGETALMLAVMEEDGTALPILLSAGSNVRATDSNGSTALHLAAKCGSSPAQLCHFCLPGLLC